MSASYNSLTFVQPSTLSLHRSSASKSSPDVMKTSKKPHPGAAIGKVSSSTAINQQTPSPGSTRNGSTTTLSNTASYSSSDGDYQDYLFADYFAFKRLQTDSSFKVSFDRKMLQGYETYIVEQWACERKVNTCITSYTGNSDHKIVVSALRIPRNRSLWPTSVVQYFDEISKLHLRPKETSLGLLFVTNISSFPSNLNLVCVPSGTIEDSQFLFIVNEDLRRTACSGRSLLTIGKPTAASEDKFRQLFKINDKVPIPFAVIELVTLVQISLYYCGLLEARYADGLLCDVTIHAIKSWWDTWGRLRYGGKPNEVGMGPTTVSALLGFIIAIKARFSAVGFKPPKDPFDAQSFVACIKHFQKHEHLAKTGKIDDETFFRLLSLYEKNSNNDFFVTIRSTMKEVSGKSVQNNCNAETTDLERLISSYVQGARTRYLWHGKGHSNAASYAPAVMYCNDTGLPLSSLQTSGEHTSGNMDIGKAMIRSVVTHRRGKSDVPSQAKEDVQYSARLTSATAANASKNRLISRASMEPEIYDEETLRNIKSPSLDLNGINDGRHLKISPGSGDYLLPNNDGTELKRRHSPIRSIHRHSRRSKRQQDEYEYQGQDQDQDNVATQSYQDGLRKYLKNSKQLMSSPFIDEDDEDDNFMPITRNRSRPRGDSEGKHLYGPQAVAEDDDEDDSSESHNMDELNDPMCTIQRVHSYDDMPALLESYKRKLGSRMKRRYSTSDIQEAVFKAPCCYVIPDAAQLHLKNIGFYSHVFENETGSMNDAVAKLTGKISTYDGQIKNTQAIADNVDYRLQSSFRREQAFKNQVTDLATIGARLQYECRMLDSKIRDAEEAVNSFAEKVTSLEARIDKVISCRNESMDFVSPCCTIVSWAYNVLMCFWFSKGEPQGECVPKTEDISDIMNNDTTSDDKNNVETQNEQ